MCLAIPGEIKKINKEIAEVDFGGVIKKISLYFLENPKVGDFILVHAGFAIQKVLKNSGKSMQKMMNII